MTSTICVSGCSDIETNLGFCKQVTSCSKLLIQSFQKSEVAPLGHYYYCFWAYYDYLDHFCLAAIYTFAWRLGVPICYSLFRFHFLPFLAKAQSQPLFLRLDRVSIELGFWATSRHSEFGNAQVAQSGRVPTRFHIFGDLPSLGVLGVHCLDCGWDFCCGFGQRFGSCRYFCWSHFHPPLTRSRFAGRGGCHLWTYRRCVACSWVS